MATCNDCHIPHTFPAKYIVKALNGWNHSVAFTLGTFPEPIQITPLNKVVALNNCGYCHGEVMSLVDHAGQTELDGLHALPRHRRTRRDRRGQTVTHVRRMFDD